MLFDRYCGAIRSVIGQQINSDLVYPDYKSEDGTAGIPETVSSYFLQAHDIFTSSFSWVLAAGM
jgi:hypothetical protein